MASEQQQPKIASSTPPDVTSKSIIVHPMSGALKNRLEGPFQIIPDLKDGPKTGYEAKTVKEGLYVRVDMPGVEMENLKVTWEKKKVSFVGEAPRETENDAGGRNYEGVLDFSSGPVAIYGVKTNLQNGVRTMVLVGSGFQPWFSTTSRHFESYGFIKVLGRVSSDTFVVVDRLYLRALPGELKGFYPFQVGGATGSLESKCTPDRDDFGFFYRTDLPGVSREGFSLRTKNNSVFYGGKGVKSSEYDNSNSTRTCFGIFRLYCGCCNVKGAQFDIKAGVLRMLVQKERIKTKLVQKEKIKTKVKKY